MRVMTRDTLLLLERISSQLGNLSGGDKPMLLSQEPRVRAMAFPEPATDAEAIGGNGTPVRPPDDPTQPLPGYDPLSFRPNRERR